MKNIGGFFEKFNSKITKEIQNLDFILKTIQKHTGISIPIENIKISNGVIQVKGSGVEKNEIFIKKTRILKDLKEGLRGLTISDIR